MTGSKVHTFCAHQSQKCPQDCPIWLRALCAAGRARPLASAPSELAWIFAAHDDGAADEPAAKKPSRGAQLPDPLFRRVVLYWL